MNEEFVALLKSLKIPMLNAEEIAALRQLEQEWRHWDNRRQELYPQQTAGRQQAAYDAFMADPSDANEHRLVALADPKLSEMRYALLRRAFEDLRGRVGAQAAKIIKPVVARIMEALSAERERRRAKVEKFMDSQNRDPHVKEVKKALDFVECISRGVQRTDSQSPLAMASVLAKG